MMDIFALRKKTLATLLLAFMAVVMLPACSSTEETSSGGSESCSERYSNEVDIRECELRENTP